MRPIGLVAAAAAGIITPLAIAMPALASTQSPVLGGVASIVDGNNGPDNGDNRDDNGDNRDNHGDNHDDNRDNRDNHGDRGDRYDDNGDRYDDHGRWDDSDPHVKVYASGSRASGDVSFLLDISNLGPFDDYVLNSPALDAGCSGDDISGSVAESDRFGHLNVAGDATNCIPGKYKIAVSQTGDAERTYYADVKVH